MIFQNVGEASLQPLHLLTKETSPADTPPGQDSRITIALKKHYIKQVSDPRQLPSWLFSDVERQVGRSYSRRESGSTDVQDEASRPPSAYDAPAPTRSRARHDDAYMAPQLRGGQMKAATYNDEAPAPTRAATRLRAMRDAKRGPTAQREVREPTPPSVTELEQEPRPVVSAPPPRPRVGLPPRPGRVRRE
jgi:hypothetical protein